MFNDESAKYIFIPNLFHCQTLFYLEITTDFASKEEQINIMQQKSHKICL